MKLIKLVHNPTAGDEEHDKEHLVRQIEAQGFECRYSSTKDDSWKDIEADVDLVAIAGGDGTVRKVVKRLLKENKEQLPIAILALGTANNIAKTFDISSDTRATVEQWHQATEGSVDIGLVENVPDVSFFLEGLGFGVFPYLMKQMKKEKESFASPEEELRAALKKLHEILLNYEPRQCVLEVDGTDHSGKFYMVEVMNIKSIGPNVSLAPSANPCDGELEVVLVPESQKEKFARFLLQQLTDNDEGYQFHTLKGKKISIKWDGTRIHADDKMLTLKEPTTINIKVMEGALKFLLRNNS
jgi:diacylglycerol kinase (ATP)